MYSVLHKKDSAHEECIWSCFWGRYAPEKKKKTEEDNQGDDEKSRDSVMSDEPPTDFIVTGGVDDLVKVWELQDDRLVLKHNLEGHSLGVVSVAVSNSGKLCASSSLDSSMRIWDLEKGEKIANVDVGPVDLWTVAFSPDDNFIISGSQTGKITAYSVETAKAEQTFETRGKFTLSIAYESYFQWCFGVAEPDCYGIIDVKTGSSILFVPKLPLEYAIWLGRIKKLDEYRQKYNVTQARYVEQLKEVIKSLGRQKVLTLSGTNSDSKLQAKEAHFDGIEDFNVNNTILFPIIANLRVFKTDHEIVVMKYVIDVSSAAHRHVMKIVKDGMYEYQCESEFLNFCYKNGGCRHTSYTCVCGSGLNAAVLHYGHAAAPNNARLINGGLALFDMGGNYFGYCADITITVPVGGKFSPDQKFIYEAVLKANRVVFKSAKPGDSWIDMHLKSNRVLLEELKNGGLLQGSVDDMMDADLAAVFQPHGLGHLIGLDAHDVGGYLEGCPERIDRPGVGALRTSRKLEKNMLITIEPGCYFIDHLLNGAIANEKQSKFLVQDVLKRFRSFGGVRIEDDGLVTEDGLINLVKVPRTVAEIEDWMAGKDNQKFPSFSGLAPQ